MAKATPIAASKKERKQRVAQVRELMRTRKLDAYIVRGTDRYLNEYVPIEESNRAWLSGFTGSVADLLLTDDKAWVFVDGRYYLQADKETDAAIYDVVKVPLGKANEQEMYAILCQLTENGVHKVGYEPERFSAAEHRSMCKALDGTEAQLLPQRRSLVETARGTVRSRQARLRQVSVDIAGRSVDDKLAELRQAMLDAELGGLVIQALDDIAYLTNLRGNEISFQATFRAVAVVTPVDFAVALPGTSRDKGLELPKSVRFIGEREWADVLTSVGERGERVGYDESTTTEAVRAEIEKLGAVPVGFPSPLRDVKARKNPAELKHMLQALRKADKVIWATQRWFSRKIDEGEAVTEADLSQEMARRFKRSGGKGLSFEVIAAAGANGAIIHHSHPDPSMPILPGTMVLLDTGTFYDGGYATDLTRTFIAGRREVEATERQKLLFTTVLKGAIAAMAARIPVGTKGVQLDAICRAPIWSAGFQYIHGTGHGVGINVHEMPPRVSPIGNQPLEPGQVFSIEPGIYIEGEGGVRIENLCTVVEDSEREGFLRVVPLTFSPLDKRLIDNKLLNRGERDFLKWSAAMWKHDLEAIPDPPPLVS